MMNEDLMRNQDRLTFQSILQFPSSQ